MTPYLIASPLSMVPCLKHGFFTRHGGVSHGDFATLNTAREKGDDLGHVQENRRRIAQALGFKENNLIIARQVHSANVVMVDRPFQGDPPEADALITTVPGLLLGVLTADCVPVLLSSTQGNIVAAVHAGWRGASGGILEATVEQMRGLGAKNIIAALGPCIWQESYEVSQEFYDNLPSASSFFAPSPLVNHWQFDLPGYVMSRLKIAKVDQISPSPVNTFTNPDRFFSYRRKMILGEKQFGCFLSGIGIQ